MTNSKQDLPSPFQVGLNFTLGGAAAILLAIVIPGNILAAHLGTMVPNWLQFTVSTFAPFAGLIIGGFASGAIGAESLKKGVRLSLVFGTGFVLPAIAVPIILQLIRGLGGREDALRILAPFAAGFAVSFLLAGAAGAAVLRQGLKRALRIAIGFGAGGLAGGIVTAFFFIFRSGFHGMMGIPTLIAGWLLPYFIGGSVLGSVLRRQNSKQL